MASGFEDMKSQPVTKHCAAIGIEGENWKGKS